MSIPIEITDEVRASHADLSPAAADFLDYVAADPEERARPIAVPELPDWVHEVGAGPHDVVWGTFCFGDRYGGGFLRMMPRGEGDGIINAARGATEGFLFEI